MSKSYEIVTPSLKTVANDSASLSRRLLDGSIDLKTAKEINRSMSAAIRAVEKDIRRRRETPKNNRKIASDRI